MVAGCAVDPQATDGSPDGGFAEAPDGRIMGDGGIADAGPGDASTGMPDANVTPAPDCGPRLHTTGGSKAIAPVRAVNFANIPLEAVIAGPGGYHAGIDISLGGYVPGHHADDPYYGANVMASVGPLSYYRVVGPGDHPFGVFINNQDTNDCTRCTQGEPCAAWCDDRCTEAFEHGWANRVTSASVEVYPKDAGYGGVRIAVGGFGHFANGGAYSASAGVVRLPRAGEPGVSKLNGFVWATAGGAPVGDGRVTVDIFHFGPERLTSTGLPMHGFGSTHTNGDGYYRFDALFYGRHKTYVTDNVTGRKKVVWIDLGSPDVRLDFVLDHPCFGMATCEDP